jgi:hypothetical protein
MKKPRIPEGRMKSEKAPKSLKSAMGAKMDAPGKSSPTVKRRKGAR